MSFGRENFESFFFCLKRVMTFPTIWMVSLEVALESSSAAAVLESRSPPWIFTLRSSWFSMELSSSFIRDSVIPFCPMVTTGERLWAFSLRY